MLIFVVQGSTGEYSDHREWIVKAFRSEQNAQRLVEDASAYARKLQAEADVKGDSYWNIDRTSNPFDQDMLIGYTGTNYTYFPVELED